MAMRRSRKKEPSKEKYILKEKLKIEEGVFDTRTLQRIGKLFGTGIISRFDFKIATGKESDIFLVEPGPKVSADILVLKIFRIETTSFRDRLDYILGDTRFGSVKGNMHAIVDVWCKKEFGNLKLAQSTHVNAPEPYAFSGNVLAMEFIGSDGMPAPQLKNIELKEPEKMLDEIIEQARRLYAAGLVHADLSEYNILVKNNAPYLIDFGQAVVKEHPSAQAFLERDVGNVLTFFKKRYGLAYDLENALAIITQ
ncbi:MAG: serine protein kinase RIO [Candidatus Micrarchaeaceae archaeon]